MCPRPPAHFREFAHGALDRGVDVIHGHSAHIFQGIEVFDGKPIEQTVIGYVFQNYREALFPWKRALDNITYPLRLAGKSSAECAARAEEVIQAFDIKFDLHRPTSSRAGSSS